MSVGTFMVARSVWDHPEFAPSAFSEREAFLWLVSEAAWKPRRKRVGKIVVDLERGQLAHSTRFLSDTWGWSHSKVRRFLERLENRDMIERDADTGVSVIYITNYDTYQGSSQASGTAPARRFQEKPKNRHSTGTQPGTDVTAISATNSDTYERAPQASGTAPARNPAQHRHSTGTNQNKGNKGNNEEVAVAVARAPDPTSDVHQSQTATSGTAPPVEREGPSFLDQVMAAAGLPQRGQTSEHWMYPAAELHVRQWITDLGLTETEVIDVVKASRSRHADPPGGPRAFDRAMKRLAAQKTAPPMQPEKGPTNDRSGKTRHSRADADAAISEARQALADGRITSVVAGQFAPGASKRR